MPLVAFVAAEEEEDSGTFVAGNTEHFVLRWYSPLVGAINSFAHGPSSRMS